MATTTIAPEYVTQLRAELGQEIAKRDRPLNVSAVSALYNAAECAQVALGVLRVEFGKIMPADIEMLVLLAQTLLQKAREDATRDEVPPTTKAA